MTSKTSLSQFSVDQHFKTKTHLDNVNGKDKDNIISKDNKITEDSTISKDNATSSGYCEICNTRYDNKKKHSESEQHNENAKERRLVDGKWRYEVNDLRLDHNMKQNQTIISSTSYEGPRFLEALEALHNIHPHFRFNTFDVV